jgi:hypothetical protein
VPLLTATVRLLAAHGRHEPVWWRYEHNAWQTPADALDNPDDYRVRAGTATLLVLIAGHFQRLCPRRL